MTTEREQEICKAATEMVANPAIEHFIYQMPDGQKAMHLSCVVGLLTAVLITADEGMDKLTQAMMDGLDDLRDINPSQS